MDKLLAGVARFQRDVFPQQQANFHGLVSGPQRPLVLFITCSDSRVVPSLITQTDPGDLFGCQVVGNIVPAFGATYGGVSATIEYAVSVLEIRHIIICGHSDCAAIKVLLDPSAVADLPSLRSWLDHAEAARRTVQDNKQADITDTELVDVMTRQNVVSQLTNLRTHPSVASRLAGHKLELHGWVYTIDTGEVRVYQEATGAFISASELSPSPETTGTTGTTNTDPA